MSFVDSLVDLSTSPGGVFLLCAGAGWAVPLPQDVSLAWAGLAVARGSLGLGPALVAGTAGIVVRDTLLYGAGRLLTGGLSRWALARRWLEGGRIRRARAFVARRGGVAILIGRFTVGARTPVFISAGAAGVPLRTFLAWEVLGALITTPLTVAAGYLFGESMVDALMWAIVRTRWVVPLALTAALGVYLLWRKSRKRSPTLEDCDFEDPVIG